MGAWGIGVFEDDSALDVLDEFEGFGNPIGFMHDAFKNVNKNNYLEYDDCINVLVSAALIDSVVNSTEYEMLTEEYNHILTSIKNLEISSLKPDAVKALERVISNSSELNELWEESDYYDNWKSNILEMITRLSS